jgi:hypothetical protein
MGSLTKRIVLALVFLVGVAVMLAMAGGTGGQAPTDVRNLESIDAWSPCQTPCLFTSTVVRGIGLIASYPQKPEWLTDRDAENLDKIRDSIANRDFGLLLSYATILHEELKQRGHDTWNAMELVAPYFAGQFLLVNLPGIPFAVFVLFCFWSLYGFTTRLWLNPVGLLIDKPLSMVPGLGSILGFIKTLLTVFAFVAAMGIGTWLGSLHTPLLYFLDEALVMITLWCWTLWIISTFVLRDSDD